MGGEKLSECLLLGWKIFNLVLKVVKPKILDVFAPEGRVPYLVFWGAGFSNQGEGALGAVGRHYKKCPLLLAFFQNCPPPHLRFWHSPQPEVRILPPPKFYLSFTYLTTFFFEINTYFSHFDHSFFKKNFISLVRKKFEISFDIL